MDPLRKQTLWAYLSDRRRYLLEELHRCCLNNSDPRDSAAIAGRISEIDAIMSAETADKLELLFAKQVKE